MSYTTFKYSDITIDKTDFSADDILTIGITVTNSGNVDGMEPVILYSSDLVASITPDVLRVRGFDKLDLKAGESKKLDFQIPASDLAFVNYDGKWTIEKGEFQFTIGSEKIKANCTETKVWSKPNI